MSRKDREPHVKRGSKLDRVLDKSHPSIGDLRFAVAELSSIRDPSAEESRLLLIVSKLLEAKEAENGLG